jgi:hypothetical protein
LLRKQEKWGRLSNYLLAELLKRVAQFGSTLIEAAESLAGGVELTKPDIKLLSIPMNLTGFKDAAEKPEVAKEFTRCLKAWIAKVRPVLPDRHSILLAKEKAFLKYWVGVCIVDPNGMSSHLMYL